MRPSDVALADAWSMWLISAAQTIPTVRHAGTAALDSPSPPARGTKAATSAVTTHAASNRMETEIEGRAVKSGDIKALPGVRAGRNSETQGGVQTCVKSFRMFQPALCFGAQAG